MSLKLILAIKNMSKKPTSKASKADVSSAHEMNRLEGVFKLMGKYNVGEIELEDDSGRVHVRMMGAAGSSSVVYAPSPAPQASAQAASPKVATSDAPKAAASPSVASNQKQILSPFVGTFYRSANPTSEPYVKEGQALKKGQVLCIIEAMKLMNEIESDFSGKVVAIHAENGQPVEFGEPLFTIEV